MAGNDKLLKMDESGRNCWNFFRNSWKLLEMNGMAGKYWKVLNISGNGWKCLEMDGIVIWKEMDENGWKWLEWPEMAEYSWTLLEMARTGWEWLEIAGIIGNGLK